MARSNDLGTYSIKIKRRQRKLDWEALRQDVQDNSDARLIDRANKFGVKVSSI
ncbi:MAG: hypothetical protein HC818_04035 [Synechococcaceae cyanobacterium RM1_1_27]|nr:hypothetical protein [Synechococcaceae cyanobacterium SM2_3_2]NJO85877.1 hypothetical protein [Synechococcaceae cyanobacterium RM1_1_27]